MFLKSVVPLTLVYIQIMCQGSNPAASLIIDDSQNTKHCQKQLYHVDIKHGCSKDIFIVAAAFNQIICIVYDESTV